MQPISHPTRPLLSPTWPVQSHRPHNLPISPEIRQTCTWTYLKYTLNTNEHMFRKICESATPLAFNCTRRQRHAHEIVVLRHRLPRTSPRTPIPQLIHKRSAALLVVTASPRHGNAAPKPCGARDCRDPILPRRNLIHPLRPIVAVPHQLSIAKRKHPLRSGHGVTSIRATHLLDRRPCVRLRVVHFAAADELAVVPPDNEKRPGRGDAHAFVAWRRHAG
jgi:hypothetical protein